MSNNFLTIARMLQVAQKTKNQTLKDWAISQGKQALLAETILNPIK